MRNIFRGLALFLSVFILIVCILDISNSGTKQKETSALAKNAAYDALKIKLTGEYDLENNDELIGEIIRNIAISKYSNSDVKIQVLGIDAENGLIDINVIQTIEHVNGKTSTEEERRTVIIETVKQDSGYVYDFNNDGLVDEDDVKVIEKYISGEGLLSDSQKQLADLDGNGTVDQADADTFRNMIGSGDERILQKK